MLCCITFVIKLKRMKTKYTIVLILLMAACMEKPKTMPTAQEIVDRSIAASGGELYRTSDIAFKFRDLYYESEWKNKRRLLKRIIVRDTAQIEDVLCNNTFRRLVNDSLVPVSDSLANLYSNSVNSVHYFANLPYGLNDPAVNKEILGETRINNTPYYKLKITFEQEGGGDDYDDVYVYWFNKETYKPDYLAYEFHVNGGGIRFRAAYNERYVNGIRFVDYENYEASPADVSIYKVDSLYEKNQLKLLSKIVLEQVTVKNVD